MALPASGAISVNAINVELGRVGTTQASLNDSALRTLAGVPSGTIDLQDFHGKANYSPMVASGGVITTYGDYKVHTFTSGGTFQVTSLGTTNGAVEYLLVGGGGAGGTGGKSNAGGAGGGGAGGFITGAANVGVTSYPVSVGSGGVNSNGSPSTLFGLTAQGGGKGGNYPDSSGSGGGSGGAPAGSYMGAQGAIGYGTSGQGNNSGSGYKGDLPAGGGGGGAGAVGGNAYGSPVSYGTAGNGGTGQISALRTGSNQYYAGGGGGSKWDAGGSNGLGGAGGGGNGVNTYYGDSGVANTGGGGGGGSNAGGGNGGSGIVVIRYRINP